MNTKCLKEETLADFLEGRVSEKRRHEIEAHLADCDRCLQEVAIGGRMVRGGDLEGTEPVPESITREAIERIAVKRQKRRAGVSAKRRRIHPKI